MSTKLLGRLDMNKLSRKQRLVVITLAVIPAVVAFLLVPVLSHPSYISLLTDIGVWLGAFSLLCIAHELMHGLGFIIYAHTVTFGVYWKTPFGPCPYASDKGRVVIRSQVQQIALAPQLLSLGLIVASQLVAGYIAKMMLVCGILNIGLGSMDIFTFLWLYFYPSTSLVMDTKGGVDVYNNICVKEIL